MIQVLEVFVENYGLLAVFVTMLLESALVPIPSEIVVPLGGFLASKGYFSLSELVFVTSFANLIGSVLAYYFGTRMGWIHRVGFLEDHLRLSKLFFDRHGLKAVFIARMLPAVRTFISLPAGLAGVPFVEFAVLTFLGSIPWNFALGYAGFVLGSNWELVHVYGRYLTAVVVLSMPVLYLLYRKYEKLLEVV